METQNFFKSKIFKIMLPFVIVLGIVYLVQTGYTFGQWLQDRIN